MNISQEILDAVNRSMEKERFTGLFSSLNHNILDAVAKANKQEEAEKNFRIQKRINGITNDQIIEEVRAEWTRLNSNKRYLTKKEKESARNRIEKKIRDQEKDHQELLFLKRNLNQLPEEEQIKAKEFLKNLDL